MEKNESIKVVFNDYKDKLDIDKIRSFQGVLMSNYLEYRHKNIVFDQNYQAKSNVFIIGKKDIFISPGDLIVHYSGMHFYKEEEFKLPKNFYERVYEMVKIDKEKMIETTNSMVASVNWHFRGEHPRKDQKSNVYTLFDFQISYNDILKAYSIKRDPLEDWCAVLEYDQHYLLFIDPYGL